MVNKGYLMNFDLVDEMEWEDHVEWVTLEDAGFENVRENDTVPAAQQTYYKEEA